MNYVLMQHLFWDLSRLMVDEGKFLFKFCLKKEENIFVVVLSGVAPGLYLVLLVYFSSLFLCAWMLFSNKKHAYQGLIFNWRLLRHLRPLNQLRYMHSLSNSHHIITLLAIHWQLIIIRWLGTQTYTSKDEALKLKN